MNRTFSKRALRILFGLALATLVSAQVLAAPNPAAAEAQRKSAASQADQASTLLEAANKLPAGEVRAAAIAQAQAMKAIADARLELADAYEAGDNDAIKASTAKINDAGTAYGFTGRVVNARRSEATYSDPAAVANWEPTTKPAAQPQLAAALKSRADAAAAWKAVAELASKSTDNDVVSESEDVAIEAGYNYQVAVRNWQYANEIAARREAGAKLNNPAYNKHIEAIEMFQAKVLENYRAQFAATLADRKLARERAAMLVELAEIAQRK